MYNPRSQQARPGRASAICGSADCSDDRRARRVYALPMQGKLTMHAGQRLGRGSRSGGGAAVLARRLVTHRGLT